MQTVVMSRICLSKCFSPISKIQMMINSPWLHLRINLRSSLLSLMHFKKAIIKPQFLRKIDLAILRQQLTWYKNPIVQKRSMRTNMVLNAMLMVTLPYVTPVIKYFRCQNMRSIFPTSARSRWPSARSALRSFQAACCPTTWTGARWRCVIRALLLASSASSRWKRKSWRIMPSPIWSTKKW